MRENTRCEVDEPMSTPTVRRQISSSSASVRPVLEKKMRPPSASAVMNEPSLLRQLAFVVLVVEFRLHPVFGAVAPQGLVVFLADVRIFHPVRNRRAAFGDVHSGVVDMSLARRTGLAPGIVRPEPGGEPQRLLGRAEMLMEPAGAAGRRRHHADRLVVDALDLL